jgi:PAS domain S-box-containing protein
MRKASTCDLPYVRTEKAPKVSEAHAHPPAESAPKGTLIVNADTGRIEDADSHLAKMFGCSHEELLSKKIWEIRLTKSRGMARAKFRKIKSNGCVQHQDTPLKSRTGQRIQVKFVSDVLRTNGREVVPCHDRTITKRKRAEEKDREYSHKLEVLSRQLVEAQETERRNIAHELHDEIGQALTVIEFHLQAMMDAPDRFEKSRLKECLAAVEQVQAQVQDISLNLRPSILDDLGLEPALRWITERQAALVGWKIHFQAAHLAERLDPVIETACFRITQEALTNVVRHARAKTVEVSLSVERQQLQLHIRDDGAGFPIALVRERALNGASLGLLGMEERAILVGGELQMTSAPGQGTEVHAWFPLKWRTNSESKK